MELTRISDSQIQLRQNDEVIYTFVVRKRRFGRAVTKKNSAVIVYPAYKLQSNISATWKYVFYTGVKDLLEWLEQLDVNPEPLLDMFVEQGWSKVLDVLFPQNDSEVLVPVSHLDKKDIERGTQIVAIPLHIQKRYRDGHGRVSASVLELATDPSKYSPNHPEFGFITSFAGTGCFCRFFYHPKLSKNELRTKANSELVPWNMLFYYNHRPQEQINKLLEEYC